MSNTSYVENKRSKDQDLYKKISRSITLDVRRNDITKEDFAHDLGTQKGYLEQKLKPSVSTNDLGLSEFIHILETTGDLSPLEHLAAMFGMVLIPKNIDTSNIQKLDIMCDDVMMESNDTFNVSKKAFRDAKLTADEKEQILKEGNEELTKLVMYLHAVKSAKVEDEQ